MTRVDAAAIWIRDPLGILATGAAGGVVVRGGRIEELIPTGGRPTTADAAVFEAGAHVVLPGLINTHHHFYQTLTRATPAALNRSLFDWLDALYPVWAGLTPEALDAAATVALAELLLSGCTTTADHHYVFPPGLDNAIDIEAAAARRLGIRVLAIAAHTEATLVGFLGRKQDVGRVRDGQKMPSFGAAVGPPAGGDQHFVRTDGGIGEEVVELERLIPVASQPVDAKRTFTLDRVRQDAPKIPQTFVVEPSKCRRVHALSPGFRTNRGIDSENQGIRKSFRSCTTTVGQSRGNSHGISEVLDPHRLVVNSST